MTDDAGTPLEAIVVGSVAITARALQSAAPDLTIVQWRLLVLLANRGPLTVGELADRLGVTSSAVSRLVRRVADRSLVVTRRSAADRRTRSVAVSPAGAELVALVVAARRNDLDRVELRPDDRASIERLADAFRHFG
jgi:DNA-binding MarR family transcriptional regulator